MTRRKKGFEERREELKNALTILTSMLRQFEESGNIAFLQEVAGKLRSLVVYVKRSRSLNHPLLIDLANEAHFPLNVFTIDQNVVNSLINLLNGHQLEFFSTGDFFSLEKTPPYMVQQNLLEALESNHVLIETEELSIIEVIRLVAETEAYHYDPSRPDVLDQLDTINIGGLTPEYRTIYNVGKVVRELGHNFLESTSKETNE